MSYDSRSRDQASSWGWPDWSPAPRGAAIIWDAIREERRSEYRHTTLMEPSVRIAWVEGRRRRVDLALLINLSRGGAAVRVAALPAASLVELQWAAGPAGCRIAARPLGAVQLGDGSYRLRLAFEVPCPEVLIRWALYGRQGDPGGDSLGLGMLPAALGRILEKLGLHPRAPARDPCLLNVAHRRQQLPAGRRVRDSVAGGE